MQEIIFVFGSNLAGKHGAGAAKDAARYHGAVYGQGIGFQGRSYAIPTKDKNLKVLSIKNIKSYIDEFIFFAENNTHIDFNVTKIGCGLAGYSTVDIAPLFKDIKTDNIHLPIDFKKFLNLGV